MAEPFFPQYHTDGQLAAALELSRAIYRAVVVPDGRDGAIIAYYKAVYCNSEPTPECKTAVRRRTANAIVKIITAGEFDYEALTGINARRRQRRLSENLTPVQKTRAQYFGLTVEGLPRLETLIRHIGDVVDPKNGARLPIPMLGALADADGVTLQVMVACSALASIRTRLHELRDDAF